MHSIQGGNAVKVVAGSFVLCHQVQWTLKRLILAVSSNKFSIFANDWKHALHLYYQERKPGDNFTPDQWMCTTIIAIWTFALKAPTVVQYKFCTS
jgi:hypothetical protein